MFEWMAFDERKELDITTVGALFKVWFNIQMNYGVMHLKSIPMPNHQISSSESQM